MSFTCISCRATWTPDRIAQWRKKHPEVPARFCPEYHCGPAYVRNLRRRQRRKPTLPQHVINVLGIAGYGNASRGARHLIDAHKENPIALDLGLKALNKWLAHLPSALCWPRVTALSLSDSHYESMRVIYEAGISTLSPEQRRRPGRGGYKTQGKTVAMAPVLCALARRFEQDIQYNEAVRSMTPAVERALACPTSIQLEEDWLS